MQKLNTKNQLTKSIFLFIILLTNTLIFFSLQYYLLSLSFSILSFIYTFLFILSFVFIIHISIKTSWKILLSISFVIFILLSLINFLHFEVFQTFISLHSTNLQNTKTILPTIKEFYTFIPLYLYLGALLFAFLQITSIFLLSPKEKNKFRPFIMIICFLLTTTCALSISQYYKINPKANWWNEKEYANNIGFFGSLYTQININDIAYATQDTEIIQKAKTLDDFKNALAQKSKINNPIPSLQEKPNILIYQLESVSMWPLTSDPNPMPYLQKLMDENITVKNFIANGCHTIDAEYATLCSFYPHSDMPIAEKKDNTYDCLPSTLQKKHSYNTAVFHTNVSDFWNRTTLMKKWGMNDYFFVPYYSFPKMDDSIPLETAVNYIANSKNPAFTYVIGYTSHGPHTNQEIEWNKIHNNIDISFYQGKINQYIKKNTTLRTEADIKAYIGFLQEIDRDIEKLFTMLKNKDLLKNTIVVIFSDHRYYGFHGEDQIKDMYLHNKIPFVMYLPTPYKKVLKDFGSHIDIAPTLLNLIESENYIKPTQFIGESLFSKDHPNHVLLKCNKKVNYFDNTITIKGDSHIGIYANAQDSSLLSKKAYPIYKENLKKLIEISNSYIDEDIIYNKKSPSF
jgi:lipoteichoic acid synthase